MRGMLLSLSGRPDLPLSLKLHGVEVALAEAGKVLAVPMRQRDRHAAA